MAGGPTGRLFCFQVMIEFVGQMEGSNIIQAQGSIQIVIPDWPVDLLHRSHVNRNRRRPLPVFREQDRLSHRQGRVASSPLHLKGGGDASWHLPILVYNLLGCSLTGGEGQLDRFLFRARREAIEKGVVFEHQVGTPRLAGHRDCLFH